MLDIKFIRENKELVKENTRKRKSKVDIDELLGLDDKRREILQKVEGLRQEVNSFSKGKPNEEELSKLKDIKVKLGEDEERLKMIESEFWQKMSLVPNMSSPDMPEGVGEEDNVEVKAWIPGEGYLNNDKLGKNNKSAEWMPKKEGLLHHQELGESLDILDIRQSALTSGSRFVYLKNEIVLVQYALQQLLIKKLIEEGFQPFIPPLLVKERVLFGTSHFPEGRDQVYKIESENVEKGTELFLVGSSEPSLFGYHMDKIYKKGDLPYKMFAITTCFRSEVGSWGKDVRGIKRVHQFDKLEMDVVTTAEQSEEIFNKLLEINEWMLQKLELPYHIINKCHGDCGYQASYKQFDFEAWLPGEGKFIELGTDTNATDFQARRMNIKYIDEHGEKKYAHTVNDTGCALGRMLIAIMENYQQNDGSIKIPEVLIPFIGFSEIKSKN